MTKYKECPECEGEGEIYEDTSYQCTKQPWQECCGGCGYMRQCPECEGEGEVEDWDEEE